MRISNCAVGRCCAAYQFFFRGLEKIQSEMVHIHKRIAIANSAVSMDNPAFVDEEEPENNSNHASVPLFYGRHKKETGVHKQQNNL